MLTSSFFAVVVPFVNVKCGNFRIAILGKIVFSWQKIRSAQCTFQRIARFFIQFVMICLFLCAIYLYTYNTVDSSFIRLSLSLYLFLFIWFSFHSTQRVYIAGIFQRLHNSTLSLHNISIFIIYKMCSVYVLYILPSILYCHLFCTFFLSFRSLSLFPFFSLVSWLPKRQWRTFTSPIKIYIILSKIKGNKKKTRVAETTFTDVRRR